MFKNLTDNQIQLFYNSACENLQHLISFRINTSELEIWKELFSTKRKLLSEYCKSKNLDFAEVCNSTPLKSEVAMSVLEKSIKELMTIKAKLDIEIKEKGLETYTISNGLEKAPWLVLFKSPLDLKWWTINTNKVFNAISEEDKQLPEYLHLTTTVKLIHDNWIKPGEIIPDIKLYKELINKEVHPKINALVLKHIGK
jgi:hypothetical protein